MTLILRKCKSDGSSRNRFKYGKTGERVTCPDWDPKPECGHGLHGLKEGNGDWELLEGHDWLIIDADDQIVDIDEEKCKFNTGVILFRGTAEELANSEYPNKLNLNSQSAYQWARHIGNHDIMMHKITESEDAYCWAKYIGNYDIMINKITNSGHAYEWAVTIGNEDIMINKIIDSECAYKWAKNIGDKDIMINKITDSYWAFCWAMDIGDKDVMINKITDSPIAFYWAFYIGDRDIMINKIDNSESAFWWAKDFGNQDIMKEKVIEERWIQRWNFVFPDNRIERQ